MKPLTLPTGKMAKYLGISSDTLNNLKRKGIFKKGIHYTIPQGMRNPLWDVEKMEEWAQGKVEISPEAEKVLDYIV